MIKQRRSFPRFEGRLLQDDASIAAAADGFGHIVHRRPAAVLQPASADDVALMIRYARDHGLQVAPRGQGHSTHGQAQVEGGVVLDLRTLARVREVTATSALVDAGIRWCDLLERTLLDGLAPPTLTDYLKLTVGGTLSVGGVGGESFRYGAQVDNVLELEVVTGAGDRVRCSPEENADLFDACRAGLGQFGVIVGARLRLLPVPPNVRVYVARYDDISALLDDQRRAVEDERFDYLMGELKKEEDRRYGELLATKRFAPGSEPDDARLLSDLSCPRSRVAIQDMTYRDFALRIQEYEGVLRERGVLDVPHPWLDMFLPLSKAADFIASEREAIDDHAAGVGMTLIYPLRRSRCHAPFFRLPEEEHLILFDLLRNAVPPTPERVQLLLDENARLHRKCAAIGGKIYMIGSLPMDRSGWEQQLHPQWERFEAAKRRFDPDNVLTPGQEIFPSEAGAPRVQERSLLPSRVRSLGCRTDLMLASWEGRVVDRGDHLVAHTPSSPHFYFGNFLLFPDAPAPGDLERWTALFRDAFAADPAIRHICLRWDRPDGERGAVQPFADAGFVINETTVHTAVDLRPPPRPSGAVQIRPLATDADWEAATRLQIAVASERLPNAGAFQRDQMARYRRFVRAGRGQWFGAFDGGALVADLGVFVEEGVARFQAVETAPSHRGRGICGTLVHEAGRRARADLGAERLVMVADPAGRAARVYRSVGFEETERLVALWLTPDRVDERRPRG